MVSDETHDNLQELSSKICFSASGVAMRLVQGLHRAKRERKFARKSCIFCENVEIGNAKPSLGVGESGQFCESVISMEFLEIPGRPSGRAFQVVSAPAPQPGVPNLEMFANDSQDLTGSSLSSLSQGLQRGFRMGGK